MNDKSNQELAHEIQTKLHFYLIGLVFTVLAVAVETAKFAGSLWASLFELAAWGSLFISGVFGILRLETLPSIYMLSHFRDYKTSSGDEDAATRLTSSIERENKRLIYYYSIHKWLLIVGFACLIVSRGFIPFSKVIEQIHKF